VRVLLDEQLPRRLARELTGHDIRTVQQQGWAGLQNGELLRRAADEGFDVFLTADQNLQFQQNLGRARMSVVVLVAQQDRRPAAARSSCDRSDQREPARARPARLRVRGYKDVRPGVRIYFTRSQVRL
jgi:hypothetical protein